MMEKGTSLQTEAQCREKAGCNFEEGKINSVLPEQSGTEAFIKASNALFPE